MKVGVPVWRLLLLLAFFGRKNFYIVNAAKSGQAFEIIILMIQTKKEKNMNCNGKFGLKWSKNPIVLDCSY
jgi:hypothetical protein